MTMKIKYVINMNSIRRTDYLKRLLLLCFVCVNAICSRAQDIKGEVVDKEGKALAFVNVVLIDAADSSFISGTITSENGYFQMDIPKQECLVKASFVGYKTVVQHYRHETLKIVLQEDTQVLKDVTVKAETKAFEMGHESIVMNVAGTALSKVGTAEDVLQNVPGMTKTKEGYMVFGKGEPLIYLNGRNVRSLSELDNLKSEDVKRVELIQNPGTKYAADVRAVVKIWTLKPKGRGGGAGLRSVYEQSKNTDLTEQVDFSYYNKKIYAFSTYKFNREEAFQHTLGEQTVFADTLWRQQNNIDNYIHRRSHELTVGFNLDVTDKQAVGMKYMVTFTPHYTTDMKTGTDLSADNQPLERLYTQTASDNHNPFHHLNVYYNGMPRGISIDFNVDYLFNKFVTEQHNHEISRRMEKDEVRDIISTNRVRNNMLAAKLILGHNLAGGKLSTGVEVVSNNRHDDYCINRTDIVADVYSRLTETQLSPFVEYRRMTPVGLLGVGMRYERVNFKYYNNGKYVPELSRKFNEVYPSVSLETRLGKVMMSLSYSVKTKRPTFRQLSNNIVYVNRFTLQSGEPTLKSEHIHDVSLSGVYSFLQFMFSYQDTRDAIIYWADQLTDNSSVTYMKFKNLTSLKSFTAYVAAAPEIGLWSPRLGAGVRKQWLNFHTMSGSFHLNKPLLNLNFNNAFSLPWNLVANVNLSYQGKGNYQNIYLSRDMFVLNAGVTKSFLKNALTLKLEGTDLLHQRKDGNFMYNNQMNMDLVNSYDSRAVRITIRYNLNATKNKYKGTSAAEKELNRLK